MTDEIILKKAIEKAEKNGWDGLNKYEPWEKMSICEKDIVFHYYRNDISTISIFDIIFSHNFAKAFWGEKDYWKETECTCGGVDFHLGGFDMHKMTCAKIKANRGYKFHLQAMVIEENPIKYLSKFLE